MKIMKQFELTLVHRDNDKINSVDKVEEDDLVELLAKFLLVIVGIQKNLSEDLKRIEDDIPF